MATQDNRSALTDKAALVTGGARRLGAAIVRALHAEGMRVALHYHRSREAAEALAGELEAARPGSVALLQADLRELEAIGGLVESACARLGGLDALVHNASSFYPTPLASATPQQWDDLLGTNLRAPFFLAQAAAPHLRRRRGAIVHLTDIHAERPLAGYPVYCAAKAGLAALTRALAAELGPEVRVNAVAPGTILWPEPPPAEALRRALLARIPLGRRGEPEEVARAVLYLLRDAGYVSGHTLVIDGGRSARA